MSREPVVPDQGVAGGGATGVFDGVIVAPASDCDDHVDEVVVEKPGFHAKIVRRGNVPFLLPDDAGAERDDESERGAAPGAHSAASAAPSARAFTPAESSAISSDARAIGLVR